MSHACALVVTTHDDEPHAAVEKAMAPHQERDDGDRLVGTWDWWQIGGRYTGMFTDYDPTQDRANMEQCDLCGGTGDRAEWRGEPPEGQHPDGCNGCQGKGVRVKWPTQWIDYEGDVTTARAALESDFGCFALVMDGEFTERRAWNGEEFVEHSDFDGFVREKLTEAGDARVIVVDYHS